MVVPDVMPVTVPVAEMVAIVVMLLLHTPPPIASDKLIVLPGQTTGFDGVMLVGDEFTVTIAAAEQLPTVYKIVVVPEANALTRPPTEMVATEVVLLLHIPLPVASVSVIVPPMQRLTGEGLIAEGVALTVTIIAAGQVPIV